MNDLQIIFTFQTKYGVFRDALWLPSDHGLTDEEINAMKQQRLENWFAAVEAPQLNEENTLTEAPIPLEEETPNA
jgi:hypothetical protein